MLRQDLELKQGLIGQIGHALKAWDRRHLGPRSSGNDDLARLDAATGAFHRIGTRKPGSLAHHCATKPLKPFLTIVRRNRGNGAMHMGHHSGKIDLGRASGTNAQGTGCVQDMGALGRRDQGL